MVNNTQIHRQELKFKIMRKAMQLFKQKGIKAVRMDDIATTLSISKRTLYEIYATKEDLLFECVKLDADDLSKRIQDYTMIAENELDIAVTYFRFKFSDLDSLSSEFISEIKRYTSVMDFLKKHHEEQQRNTVEFIHKCVESGFFVPNIDYNIIQELCDEIFNSGIITKLSAKYTLREIFYNYFVVLLRGFCTERGLILLDNYIRKNL